MSPFKDAEQQRAANLRYLAKNRERLNREKREHRSAVRDFLDEYLFKQKCSCGNDAVVLYHAGLRRSIGRKFIVESGWSFERIHVDLKLCEFVCIACGQERTERAAQRR